MFGKRKSKTTPLSIEHETFATLVGRHTRIDGQLQVRESIRIDGELRGNVVGDPDQAVSVVVSASGVVNGDVVARRVVVAGTVEGHIHALDHVELHAGCLVQGDIKYGSIAIEHGARILGLLLQVKEGSDSGARDAQQAIRRAQVNL